MIEILNGNNLKARPRGGASNEERIWIKSSCDECYNMCAVLVEVTGGNAIRIIGDPDNPQSRGKVCCRGMSGLRKLYDPYRVKTPLIRTNPQKGIGIDPKWKEISWEEAFNLVGERLRKIREENPNKLIYSCLY